METTRSIDGHTVTVSNPSGYPNAWVYEIDKTIGTPEAYETEAEAWAAAEERLTDRLAILRDPKEPQSTVLLHINIEVPTRLIDAEGDDAANYETLVRLATEKLDASERSSWQDYVVDGEVIYEEATDEIDLTALRDALNEEGIHAHIEETGGGVQTLFAGPLVTSVGGGNERWKVSAGPASQETSLDSHRYGHAIASLGEFWIGFDTDDGIDGENPTTTYIPDLVAVIKQYIAR